MPHHGSSSEDSWRWTNYTCKWCKDLKASFICCIPEKNSYNLPQEWIRDISWPESMRTKKKSLVLAYHLNKEDAMHEKTVSERIYITGLASFYNSETSQYLHLHINDSDDITYPDEHKSLSNMKLTNISETNGEENMSEDDDSNINMSFLKENTQKTSPQTTTLIKTRKRSLNLSREEFKSPKKDLDKKQNNQKESKIKKTLKGKDEKNRVLAIFSDLPDD